jgi:2-polyprenyl-3-methyl-5-hydroxy-6-metoxy-1,4-benzoquinol methylase
MTCPVCRTEYSQSDQVGEKHGYPYFRCRHCGLLFCGKNVLPEHIRSQNLDSVPRHIEEFERRRFTYLQESAIRNAGQFGVVLDFGCGHGEFGKYVRARGYRCLEIDLTTDLCLSDLRNDSVDGAVVLDVIEHLKNPVEVFKQLRRVVRRHGLVLVETVMSEGRGVDWDMCDPTVHHMQLHTEKSLMELASATGWMFMQQNRDWPNFAESSFSFS